jgi:hypothetical protein
MDFKAIMHEKWFPWALGGVVLVVGYLYIKSGSSSSTTAVDTSIDPATGVPYAVEQASQTSAAAAGLASQQEQDQANIASATLAAQTAASSAASDTALVGAAGGAVSQIIAAQDALPVAAINAATTENQTALTGAAAVAASANSAVPGLLAASYAPLDQYGKAVANSGSVQAINSFASSVNSSEAASASVANAAGGAAASRNASNNQTMTEVGTIAAIALL